MTAAHALDFDPPDPIEPDLDPPSPDDLPQTIRVIEGEVVSEPTMLIPTASILQRMEGITAADRAQAVILGQMALSIPAIDDDDTENRVGELIDRLVTHQEHIERKVGPFADLAFKLHRALTGFRAQATQELVAGLAHLKPMLARRLGAKRDAEEARQREESARARKAEQDRILAEAAHAESVGESAAVVQQLVEEAASVPAPPVAERQITQVKGAGVRDNWVAEVSDKRALILHVAERLHAGDDSLLNLLVVDATTATQLARAQKGTMKIPGMRAVNNVSFTKRRG